MRLFLSIILANLSLIAQSQTQLTIIPRQDGSATGNIDFRELYENGQNYVGWKAPSNITSSFRLTLPSSLPVTNGNCLFISSLGVSTIAPCSDGVVASSYNWSQTIATVSSGTRTLTLTPCPITASNTSWAFRINDVSLSEVVFPTGVGTCTQGAASGTVQVILTNSYTTPTVSSASSGIQEAVFSVASGHVTVRILGGEYHVYSAVLDAGRAVNIACEGLGAAIYPRANNVKIFNSTSETGIRVSNCHLANAYALTGTVGVYSNNPIGGSYGGSIAGNWFSSLDKSVHSASTNGWTIINNHFIHGLNATAAIHMEGLADGDAGTGLIADNIMTCSATCTYGLLWNGPGAMQFKRNNLNGYTTQLRAELTFGTASSSGSTVTWASGNRFRTAWVGRYISVGGALAIIASVDSDSQITTATPLGTIAATQYYISGSSQAQIVSNNFDSGVNTTSAITWAGPIGFQSAQIENNFISNWASVVNFKAINITTNGIGQLSIRGNNIQSPAPTAGTYGVVVEASDNIMIAENQIVGSNTAIFVGAAATDVFITQNQCIQNSVACVTNGGASTSIVSNWLTDANGTHMSGVVGIGRDATPGIELAIKGIDGASNVYLSDLTGVGIAEFLAADTYGVIGTVSNHDFILKTNNTERARITAAGVFGVTGNLKYGSAATQTNCTDAAGAAACGSAAAGSVVIDAGATTVVVSTTAVTANSQIFVEHDSSLGTRLGVTCNTAFFPVYITARTAATSFTITTGTAPTTNPQCLSYSVVN